jgi:hypothetical protein
VPVGRTAPIDATDLLHLDLLHLGQQHGHPFFFFSLICANLLQPRTATSLLSFCKGQRPQQLQTGQRPLQPQTHFQGGGFVKRQVKVKVRAY